MLLTNKYWLRAIREKPKPVDFFFIWNIVVSNSTFHILSLYLLIFFLSLCMCVWHCFDFLCAIFISIQNWQKSHLFSCTSPVTYTETRLFMAGRWCCNFEICDEKKNAQDSNISNRLCQISRQFWHLSNSEGLRFLDNIIII